MRNPNFELRDIPVLTCDDDLLSLAKYAEAISIFIKESATPLTIAIQGEWGCGKTSLMNMISNLLNNNADNTRKYELLWIKTWEYFLKDDYENPYELVIMKLIKEISKLSEESDEEFRKDIQEIKRRITLYLMNMANIAADLIHISEKTKNHLIDTFSDQKLMSITNLHKSIESLVNKIANRDKSHINEIVFFVDDLDRINPETAIQLIDILKNLFDIKHCVFVIAIDYRIVIKGLQRKFGEFSIKNEQIFKSYFDKLIQLPFSIPTHKLDTISFIKISLIKIKYFREEELTNSELLILSKIFILTIRNNPRNLKRIVSLVKLSVILDNLYERILTRRNDKIINIVFICIQISFPKVYNLFLKHIDKTDSVLYNKSEINEKIKFITEFCSDDDLLINRLNDITSIIEIIYNLMNEKTDLISLLLLSQSTHVNSMKQNNEFFCGEKYNISSQTQYLQGRSLIDLVELKENQLILDIGCGNGLITIDLFNKKPNVNINAFDISKSQIEIAIKNRDKNSISSKEINFYKEDAENFKEINKYDLIFSNATLHWILDSSMMYSRIFNALKINGSIAIHQGGKDTYKELHQCVKKAITNLQYDNFFIGWQVPLFYPTKIEMQKMLLDIGFKNIIIIDNKEHISDISNLVDNFANASLLAYLRRLKTNTERNKLEKEYRIIANNEISTVFSNRLYIFADKKELI